MRPEWTEVDVMGVVQIGNSAGTKFNGGPSSIFCLLEQTGIPEIRSATTDNLAYRAAYLKQQD